MLRQQMPECVRQISYLTRMVDRSYGGLIRQHLPVSGTTVVYKCISAGEELALIEATSEIPTCYSAAITVQYVKWVIYRPNAAAPVCT